MAGNECGKCGCWKPICRCDGRHSVSIGIFKPMIYNDICETPLLIESKRQLRRECKKHNVIACRLL
ncbi:hypothetical protein LCGC14_0712650 [marine sediment metagenome]|uniref:Uncharacterized protein n=1 Tax=marine sediment metagenome TaxID=412755 RepID=A0A0F9QJ36_9ZZZZ